MCLRVDIQTEYHISYLYVSYCSTPSFTKCIPCLTWYDETCTLGSLINNLQVINDQFTASNWECWPMLPHWYLWGVLYIKLWVVCKSKSGSFNLYYHLIVIREYSQLNPGSFDLYYHPIILGEYSQSNSGSFDLYYHLIIVGEYSQSNSCSFDLYYHLIILGENSQSNSGSFDLYYHLIILGEYSQSNSSSFDLYYYLIIFEKYYKSSAGSFDLIIFGKMYCISYKGYEMILPPQHVWEVL